MAGAATLTIGANITVHGTQYGNIGAVHTYDSIINQGTINADTANRTITFSGGGGGTIQNNGTIQATAGTISFNSWNLTNTGSITQSGSGAVNFSSGTIKSGTLPGMMVAGVVTLDGITFNGDVTVQAGAQVYVKSGLTLSNVKLILATNGAPTAVCFQETQTLGGTGELVFGGTNSPNYLYVQGSADTQGGAATLTIGANVTVHGSQSGYVIAVQPYDSIINLGAINADAAGRTITLSGNGGVFQNSGTVEATAGTVSLSNWTVSNAGTLLATNGTFNVSGMASFNGAGRRP